MKIPPVKTSVLATPLDPPLTAEELAELKKYWGKDYIKRTAANWTREQRKDFRKLLTEKQFESVRIQGLATNIAKADMRKERLRELCAELCDQFPDRDIDEHVQDLLYKCKNGHIQFQDTAGKHYKFPYKSKRWMRDIIRSTYNACKATRKNQKK